ncbi:MAG: methyltransferase domain-containing protein [Salinibacter sp.]
MGTTGAANHYDQLDSFYRHLWGEHVHHGLWDDPSWSPERAVRHLVHAVARDACIQAGDQVVDIGCGYGAPARLWANAYGARVTGFTVSEAQFAYARRWGKEGRGPTPEIRLQDIRDNTLPDASADAVVAVESLTHVDPPAWVLSEAARLLRPGGRLVACVWMAPPRASAWERRHLLQPIVAEGRLTGLPAASDLHNWAGTAGLKVEGLDDRTPHVRRTWNVVLRRLARALLTDAAMRRVLLDPAESERVFARTVLRIWIAQHLGVLRYGWLVARKPTA